MTATVFFAELTTESRKEAIESAIGKLCDAVELNNIVERSDLVAIKMHFGEKGNTTHVKPMHVKPLVNRIRDLGGSPFLADTTVLYKSARSNAVSHLRLAHEHGFTMDKVGAPVFILDGLTGDSEIEVPIKGKLFDKVSIAREIAKAQAVVVVSHVTGHIATGLGATLKNLGMGLASRKGKMRQHSSMKPKIKPAKCTSCGDCIEWCPEGAIDWVDGKAFITMEKCIGCGECLTVCRFDAVQYNWSVESADLQRRIAEHALGVCTLKRDKIVFFNFLLSMTKDCDCMTGSLRPVYPDLGVMASRDPVALDKAAVDLITEKCGKPYRSFSYPHIDEEIQLRHGQEIGLGSLSYDLIEI